MPTNCGRCGTPFKADLPDWQVTVLCDGCSADVVDYALSAPERRNRVSRVQAARRLYGRTDLPTTDTSQPCDADT